MSRVLFALLLLLSGALTSTGASLQAQGTQPVPTVVAPEEAIRLYWNDAANLFASVRAKDSRPVYDDPDAPDYDLLTVPRGAQLWLDAIYNQTVSVKQGARDLRGGRPQATLYTAVHVRSRGEAERLFAELRGVLRQLPGAVVGGEQGEWLAAVRTSARKDRRELVITLGDEPEDGQYVLSITAYYNRDDVEC